MRIYGVPYINISYFTPRNYKFRKEYYRIRRDTYETLHLVSQRYIIVDFFMGRQLLVGLAPSTTLLDHIQTHHKR